MLDVKFGAGAFMKTREEAEALAGGLSAAGNGNGVRTTALLTPMDEPLGRTVGNALEVAESVETLQNKGPADLVDLTLELCVSVSDLPRETFRKHLESGKAWEKFLQLVQAQGGDARVLENLPAFHPAPEMEIVPAPQDGVIRRIDAKAIGLASVLLGAGRMVTTDPIDYAVGFSGIRKTGDAIAKGEPLLTIHARDREGLDMARKAVEKSIAIE